MSGIQELIAIPEKIGLEGNAIQQFVKEQHELERQARATRREEEQERIAL